MGEQKEINRENMQKKKDYFGAVHFSHRVVATTIDYAITLYLALLVGVMPLYFTEGYGYIATDKVRFFGQVSVNFGKVMLFLLVVYLITAFAVLYANMKENKFKFDKKQYWNRIKSRISAIDLVVGLYGVAVVVSYLCSDYREEALWGAKGWYMGLVTQLIFLCIYFGVTFLWKPRKGIMYIMLAASGVVFVLGILNRFGIYPIEMKWSNPSLISTIGNINWYCGYAVITFFAGVGMFWQMNMTKWWQMMGLACYVFIGFVSLVVQGSLSGIVAIGGMLVILFCLSAHDRCLMHRYCSVVILFTLACLAIMLLRLKYPEAMTYTDWAVNLLTKGRLPVVMTIVSFVACGMVFELGKIDDRKMKRILKTASRTIMILVTCCALSIVFAILYNTLNPGSSEAWLEASIFTFSPKWGSGRGATWMAGLQCFLEQSLIHKLVGVGPDAMSAYILGDGSEALRHMVDQSFGVSVLTNAHNEWLTVLVNLGLLGFAAFVAVTIAAVRKFVKSDGQKGMAVACVCGILAYTINNMFSFAQIMNVSIFFILLGMGRADWHSDMGTSRV